MTTTHLKSHTEWHSLFKRAEQGLTKPLADAISSLDFTSEEVARIDELSDKANEGTMTKQETLELESLVDSVDLLAYWQSSARQFLQMNE